MQVKVWRAYNGCHQEFRKQERYCQEQRDLLRALEDLTANERMMYELDNQKDQVMTVCKIALANLVMWTRNHYFPPTFAHATWGRLAPFFHLPGLLVHGQHTGCVERHPFNDRQYNRDLAAMCERVNKASLHLPDGRRLLFAVRDRQGHSLELQEQRVA